MPRHLESRLQQGCVTWFRYQYPHLSKLLIAVPNGGFRSKKEAAIMRGEGVVAGVSDLLLMVPKNGYGALGIEMKIGPRKQTNSQKQWQERFEAAGNVYVVCRNIDEFISAVKIYLTEQNAEEHYIQRELTERS